MAAPVGALVERAVAGRSVIRTWLPCVPLLVALSAGAAPQAMTREAYHAAQGTIAAHADKALAHCKTVALGAQSRCHIAAAGQKKIALAALEADYHPSANNSFKAMAAQVDLRYELAHHQCNAEHGGLDKEARAALKTCVQQAKAERTQGLQAAHQHAASQASVGAPPKSEAERKREADLDTAIRKCDSLLGEANLQCMGALPLEARQRAAERASGSPRKE